MSIISKDKPDVILKYQKPTTSLVNFRCNNFSNLSTSSYVMTECEFKILKIPIYIQEFGKGIQISDDPLYCSFKAKVSPTITINNTYMEPVVLELLFEEKVDIISEIYIDLSGSISSKQFILKRTCEDSKLYRSDTQQLVFRQYYNNIIVNILVGNECYNSTYTFEHLLLNEQYSDLKIIADEEKFYVHKAIVCSKSNVFAKMVNTEMKEQKNAEIQLKDKDPSVVKELLTYLYKGSCDLSLNTHDLFQLAHFLEVKDLQHKCQIFLKNNVNIKNIVDSLILTENDQYDLSDLKFATKYFISNNENNLVNDADFISYLTSSMNDSNISLALYFAEKYSVDKLWRSAVLYLAETGFRVFKNDEFKNYLKQQSSVWFMELLDKYINHALNNSKEIIQK